MTRDLKIRKQKFGKTGAFQTFPGADLSCDQKELDESIVAWQARRPCIGTYFRWEKKDAAIRLKGIYKFHGGAVISFLIKVSPFIWKLDSK